MKKIVIVIVAVIVVSAILFGITFAVKKYKENNALATADTVYAVSDDKGTVTVNEAVARQFLGQYDLVGLGYLKLPLNEYVLKLSEGTVFGSEACKVEAYETAEGEVPAAVFMIAGYNCYVFDADKNDYLILTLNGAFQVETSTTEETTTDFYVEADDAKLHKLIDAYTKEELGFAKDPEEYKMVPLGTVSVASDKKKVFPIKMFEKDGTPTNYTCAICDGAVYKFDTAIKQYVKLDK